MDAQHARPMTAYAALCAAAVVVLVQGLGSSGPVADSIARAGEPALTVSRTVTFAAATEVSDLGARVGRAIAGAVVPVVTDASPARTAEHAAVIRSVAGGGARQHATASVVVETSKHAGSTADSARSSSAAHPTPADRHQAQSQRKADRKADHAAAKAERHHAKDSRKAVRASAKHKH